MAVAHSKPFIVASFALRSHLSLLAPADDVQYLLSLFDWFESHPDVRAIEYVDAIGGTVTPDDLAAPAVFLDDGQGSYRAWSPSDGYDEEDDGRLLADDGVNRSALFAGRIANPRYVSAIATAAVSARVRLAVAWQLTVRARGAGLRVSWRGNDVARSYELELRRPDGPWRDVLRRTTLVSDALVAPPEGRYQVRVRAYDAIDTAGPWSPLRTFRITR